MIAATRVAGARRATPRILTFKRARTYALVLIGLYLVAWGYELAAGSPPMNAAGAPIGGDYIAFHTAGRLILGGHGAALYDRAAVQTIQAELLDGRVPGFYDAFRNPPFFALAFPPLAWLGLLPGFAAWTALSLGWLALALKLLLDEVPWLQPRSRGVLVLVLAFPPVYFGVIDGENATLSLLLYALIYRSLVRQQDRRAGVWAALGLFKPQLFLVLPLVFAASRRWRALAVYAATALALLLVSAALVGPEGMAAWLTSVAQAESGNAAANAWRMMSLASFFPALLPSTPTLALALYVATSLVLLVGLARLWWRRPLGPELTRAWAITSLVAVLVDPHLVDYDLTILVAAGVLVLASLPATLRWMIVGVYPVILTRAQLPLGDASLQLAPALLLGCLVYAWPSA